MPISIRDESTSRSNIKVSVVPAEWESYIVTDIFGETLDLYRADKNHAQQ